MVRVFVCYRRTDTPAMAGRLRDRLAAEFGERNVFMDVENIEIGVDFREAIQAALLRVDAVLVVIGARFDQQALTRPTDYVRIEIVEAIQQGKILIPVLVDDATMPAPDELPVELRPLIFARAARLRSHDDFRPDADRVVQGLYRRLNGASDFSIAASSIPPRPQTRRQQRERNWHKVLWIVGAVVLILVAVVVVAVVRRGGDQGFVDEECQDAAFEREFPRSELLDLLADMSSEDQAVSDAASSTLFTRFFEATADCVDFAGQGRDVFEDYYPNATITEFHCLGEVFYRDMLIPAVAGAGTVTTDEVDVAAALRSGVTACGLDPAALDE